MDEFVRRIMRQAQAGDPDAWTRIELALQRQVMSLRGKSIWVLRFAYRLAGIAQSDIGVYLTREGALAGAKGILTEYWSDDVGSDTIPDDVFDALKIYNDNMDGHSIEIVKETLED